MTLDRRIDVFAQLGNAIRSLGLPERTELAGKARNENPWFTEESIDLALKGIGVLLEARSLAAWAHRYHEPPTGKTIGVAMAGNIPFVGFHDLLCTLMTGHHLKIKLSSQDAVTIRFIVKKLTEIEPSFSAQVSFEEYLRNVDAVITTGSDNTARYFEYYFRNIPHILRKNRSSCAVIQGDEPENEFKLLGSDVFSYFGLGCRNVSKIFVPEEFDVTRMLDAWKPFARIFDHHKYANNYTYQKSILLVNQRHFFDNGFVLLTESSSLVSPIAVVFMEKYKDLKDLREKLDSRRDKIQVVVSAQGWYEGSIPFGSAQMPTVDDYADGIDTMKFLTNLK